jgi:integrase/recombinase XerD
MISVLLKGFEAFLQLEKGLASASIVSYLNDLRKLDEYFVLKSYELKLAEIQLSHIQDFIQYLHELDLSVASQARMVSSIKSFFAYLVLERVIETSPVDLLEAPKLDRKLPAVLSFDEVDAMLNSVDLSKAEGHRNRAILEVLYACGLRVSELTGLRISNLFLEVGFIKVLGKGNKERIVPMGETAQKYLNYYLSQRQNMTNIHSTSEDIVFLNRRGKQLTRNMIFIIVKNTAADAGISKNVSPHTFRHSFATHLIEGGADLRVIQQLLGHESITSTEIYTHLDMDFLKETLRSFHPRSK